MNTQMKVLVVEDDPVISKVAELFLRQYGVEVHKAANGAEAVAATKRHDFSLIMMDVHMPMMSGIDATKIIREGERRKSKHTPIVAITASESKQHCLEAGMDDFVTKPADYTRVIERWLPDCRRIT